MEKRERYLEESIIEWLEVANVTMDDGGLIDVRERRWWKIPS